MSVAIEGGVTVSPKQLKTVLEIAFLNKFNTIIAGPPGSGKSDIERQVAESINYRFISSHPSIKDPTEYNGFGFPGERNGRKIAEFLIYGDILDIVESNEPTVVCFEDLLLAPQSVQGALMQLVWERKLNDIRVPDHVVFTATTNRRQDKAGGQGIIEPFKSRNAIYNLSPDINDWVEWAYNDGQPAILIAFCRRNSKALFDFAPTMDIVNTPCPRTVAMLGHWINAGVPENLKLQIYNSCCGEGFTNEFMQFERVANKLQDPDYIIEHPKEARLYDDKDLDLIYITVSSLALRANKGNFANIMTYSDRLKKEYGILMVKDIIHRDKTLINTKTFSQWADRNKDVLFF
jgi:hypothetical protein